MSARPRRPDLRQQKAQEILRAAAEVFAELGYRRTRMIDVAERAGVGKGTIYEYFRTKEDLFLAIFEWYVENAMAQAEDAAGHSADPVSALRAFAASTFAELRRMLALYPLTLEFWAAAAGSEFADQVSAEFRSLYRRYGTEVAAMIRAGVDAGYFAADVPVDHVARVLVGAIDGIYLQAWFDDEFAAEEAGASFVEIVLRGLAVGAPAAEGSADGPSSPSDSPSDPEDASS